MEENQVINELLDNMNLPKGVAQELIKKQLIKCGVSPKTATVEDIREVTHMLLLEVFSGVIESNK